ncbi:MAG: hypothetical protein EOM20_00135 [Spartobacteria bacterium]|nr:hypothetical protein [Spartobacteria bacterium]
MSSGSYALPKLTEVAKGYGLDAVFLTDNITEYIQFGLPPLRNILWAGYSLPSIMTFGPENYLDAIQRENARQDDILYVAGAETCPRVYWTGALRNQDLVCHNHQRNIIALGPFDAQTLRDIPECCGFIPGKHTYWIIATRALLALFIFAIFCFLFVAPVLARRSGLSTRDIRWSALATVILPIALVCFAADWWARQQPDFQIYGEEHAPTHEQAMIDYFNRHNIVHYWAHPEAVDHHEFDYHGIRFQADTAPYPGVLLTTSGYTAFGGVYEGKNNLTDPGSLWDKALEQYLDGSRPAPAWCYGEMLYHYEGQAKTKKLGNVETVILAETRTPDALLEGLRTGQCYARRNTDANYLVLDDWKLEQTTSENADAEVTATLALSSKQPDTRATIQLIRNGEVIATDERDLPTTFSHTAPLEGKACYRAVVTAGHPLKLATNPLFTENIAAPPPQRVGM